LAVAFGGGRQPRYTLCFEAALTWNPPMRIAAIFLATALFGHLAGAQDHLEPENGIFSGDVTLSDYYGNVRRVFSSAYAPGGTLCVVILPSFSPESVVGIRESERGLEAFVITPSCHIWNLELLQDYESGRITEIDKDGRKISLAQNESYQKLKQRTPGDVSKITVATVAKPLPEPLAEQVALADRIKAVWKKALLDTRYAKERHGGNDGTDYYFSMRIEDRGIVSGQIWSPNEHTRMGDLINLVSQIAAYANGKAKATQLEDALKRLE
jgi:hypothetical protein